MKRQYIQFSHKLCQIARVAICIHNKVGNLINSFG